MRMKIISSTNLNHFFFGFCFYSFPHLFCNSVVIETLMNIINILSYSLNEDNLHKVTAHHRVPDTNYTIQFVDTHEKRLVSLKFESNLV